MKFKLKTLLLSIAFVAFVLFAMTNARFFWNKYYYVVTILILAISLTRAFVQHGDRRAFHIGFCIFGIGFLLIMFAPWKVPYYGKVTNTVMDSLHPLFEREMSLENAIEGEWTIPNLRTGLTPQLLSVISTMTTQDAIRRGLVIPGANPTITGLVSTPTPQSFRIMGSPVLALLLGLIGGIIGRLSYQETG